MAKRKVDRGQAINEQKGSLDYIIGQIRGAFHDQFDQVDDPLYVREVFADHAIVGAPGLQDEEYYLVPYTRSGNMITFAPRAEWEVVELAYVPQTAQQAAVEAKRPATERKFRLEERRANAVELLETGSGPGGPRRIRIKQAIVADSINANRRRYQLPVLRAAVEEIHSHLHESAGNGRAILLGEAEHPSDKASGRPNLLETVVKWTDVSLDEATGAVSFAGHILETSKGKDILALLEGGVLPGGSLRGYGTSRPAKDEAGESIEEVTELHLTGYDLVLEPSFANQAVLESKQTTNPHKEDIDMTPEQLKALVEANPDLFKGMVADEVTKMSADALKALEETVRDALGLNANDDMAKALREAAEARKTVAEQARKAKLDAAIAEAIKGLPYGTEMNESFAEELRESAQNVEDVKARAESLRKRYDRFAAKAKLDGMGFSGAKSVQVTGPVIERETGTPDFARVAHMLTENMKLRGAAPEWNPAKPKSINERVAAAMLARFDAVNRDKLVDEARRFEEANSTSDLALPYSVSRAINAAVWPRLIATSIFDVAPMDQTPSLLFFEAFTGETGKTATITDESVTSPNPLGSWVNLAHQRVNPGSVVVTSSPAGTTYAENTDFIIDYGNGRIFFPASGGGISAATAVLVDYTYEAIREGEGLPIQRAKTTLSSVTLTAKADRLAVDLTNEAVEFSRSQLGYDVVQRTLANLAQELAKKVDKDLFYRAIASVRTVASNTGGTFNSAANPPDYADAVLKLGKARTLVAKRDYEPTFILASTANSDLIANWSGFTASGERADAELASNGYVGRVKGLPMFASTQMPDTIIVVGNRELVAFRVFRPFTLQGPFPSYDQATAKLIASTQWYAEQYNAMESPVTNKGAYIVVS